MQISVDETDANNISESAIQTAKATVASARAARPTHREAKRRKYRRLLVEKIALGNQTVSLAAQIIDSLKKLASHDAETRRQSNKDTATFFKYYDANEYGDFDDNDVWQAYPDNELSYSSLLVQSQVDSAKTVLLKTRLEFDYAAKTETSTLDEQLAEMCKKLAEEEMARILTDDLRVEEILYLLLAGETYREHYFAADPLHTQTAEIPIYTREKITISGGRFCACGAEVGQDNLICPKCQSTEFTDHPDFETYRMARQTEQVDLPENQLRIPNPLSVQCDLSKRDIHYSFLIERDALPRSEAEYQYHQTFSGTAALDSGVKMIHDLERQRVKSNNAALSNQVLANAFSRNPADLVQRTRAWMPAHLYADMPVLESGWHITDEDGLIYCPLESDVPENAAAISYGTFLGDVFPHGMYICVIGDDLVEQNKGRVADRWLKIVYGKRPANGEGAGLKRLRSLADMKNDVGNLGMKILMDDADPKTFVNRRYASNLAAVGSFHLLDLKEGESMKDAAMRMPGAAAHPALNNKAQEIDNIAQYSAGTFSSIGNGAPGSIGGTATAVLQMAEESAGRFLEPVQQIARADIESRYIVLGNIKEHSLEAQKKALIERFGKSVAERFFAVNLRQTVKITIKKGTDQPQSQTVLMAKMQTYSQIAAQVGNSPQGGLILSDLSDALDLPLTVGEGRTDEAEARRRLGLMRDDARDFADVRLDDAKVMKSAIGIVGKTIDECEKEIDVADVELQKLLASETNGAPETVPNQNELAERSVPSVIMKQNHAAFMDVYKDWSYTTGANTTNRVLQFAVDLMWKLHFERDVIKRREMALIEARQQGAVQEYALQMQAKNQPPPPPPEEIKRVKGEQQENEDAATEKEVLMRGGEAALTDAQKDADFEREQRGKDLELERDVLRQQHAKELERENRSE